jgi:hypothetical protein
VRRIGSLDGVKPRAVDTDEEDPLYWLGGERDLRRNCNEQGMKQKETEETK